MDRIKGFKAKYLMKDDAVPKFLKARPIPYAILSKVDTELELMERTGVLELIEHSDWASPLVVVAKPNGKVRITGDFKNTVNSQLHITQYPIASPEKLFADMEGGQKFSKLDGTNAYHQMEIDRCSYAPWVIQIQRAATRNILFSSNFPRICRQATTRNSDGWVIP